MRPFFLAIVFAILIVVVWFLLRRHGGWKVLHQQFVAALTLLYGLYLATLTGTVTQLVLPGLGAVGGGAAAGAAIGFGTYLAIGVVGAVTGGVGIALGAAAMTLIGATLGASGGAAGGAGFKTVSYPLVSPLFWVPVLLLSVYLFIGARRRKRS